VRSDVGANATFDVQAGFGRTAWKASPASAGQVREAAPGSSEANLKDPAALGGFRSFQFAKAVAAAIPRKAWMCLISRLCRPGEPVAPGRTGRLPAAAQRSASSVGAVGCPGYSTGSGGLGRSCSHRTLFRTTCQQVFE